MNNPKFKSAFISSEEQSESEVYQELVYTMIPDEIIHYVVDTAQRVKIDGKIYQITEVGTFVYDNLEEAAFDSIYSIFLDVYDKYDFQLDSVTYVFGNIKFIDSYGYVEKGKFKIEDLIAEISADSVSQTESIQTKSANLSPTLTEVNDLYTSTYNLSTHKAGGKTWAGKIISGTFGENNWTETSIDSKHRVKVKLYSVNYQFYKNSGFRVEFQEQKEAYTYITFWRWKKKVVLYRYWKNMVVPEMVVGVDYFKGYTEYTTFGIDKYYNDLPKDYSQDYGTFVAQLAFKGFFKTPIEIATNWTSEINWFNGNIQLKNPFGKDFNYDLSKIEEEAFKGIIDFASSKMKSWTKAGIRPNQGYPVALFAPDASGSSKQSSSNRDYLLLQGVKKYTNKSDVSVRFGMPSGGLSLGGSSFNSLSPSGFTPNAFHVQKAFVFGAVKYNGKWIGIRQYIN